MGSLNGSFDRSKFKAASLDTNKTLVKEADEKTKIDFGSTRPGYHDIEEGKNIFRVAPPHEEGDPSIQPFRRTWLPIEVDEEKDGAKTGKRVVRKRVVWDSRIHGGTEKDIVEEYISAVYKKVYDECQDKLERQKLLYPITGYQADKWIPGIRPSTNYVLYAWKNGKLGRLEINSSIQKRMEELNINDEANEPISTDCFSDPDSGFNLIIEYNKAGAKGEKNKVNRGMNPTRLTDEQLIEFSEQDSLKSIYTNAYRRGDFLLAIEGLQNFDNEHKYHIFEMDEWSEIVTEISAYYPEEQEGDDESSSTTAVTVTTEEVSEEPSLDKMSRAELKSFIVENELDIVVKPSLSDDAIRKLIVQELEDVKDPVTSEEELEEEMPKKSPVVDLNKLDSASNDEVQKELDKPVENKPIPTGGRSALQERLHKLKTKTE